MTLTPHKSLNNSRIEEGSFLKDGRARLILRGYTLLPGESHEGLIVGVPAGFTGVFILTGVDLDIPLSRPWRRC